MKSLTSAQNQIIKDIKLIKSRKFKEDRGLFLIEGMRFVQEAIMSGVSIRNLFFSESFINQAESQALDLPGTENFCLPDKLFGELSDTKTPQGIIALVHLDETKPEELFGGTKLFVLLDSVQDPGNVGTIIRTADAAGFAGVIASKGCVDIYNPKVLRSTMGSIFHIPVVNGFDLTEAVKLLKEKDIKVFASHLQGAVSCFDADLTSNAAIIIGSEARGISEETASLADVLLKIPMPGSAESLNAAVAAGILMFESVRQRAPFITV